MGASRRPPSRRSRCRNDGRYTTCASRILLPDSRRSRGCTTWASRRCLWSMARTFPCPRLQRSRVADVSGETELYLGFEGFSELVDAQVQRARALCASHGGVEGDRGEVEAVLERTAPLGRAIRAAARRDRTSAVPPSAAGRAGDGLSARDGAGGPSAGLPGSAVWRWQKRGGFICGTVDYGRGRSCSPWCWWLRMGMWSGCTVR